MKRLSIPFIVLLMIAFYFPYNASAIEGGIEVSENDFTVLVVAQKSGSKANICSGALLNDFLVVTAAHCINDELGLISKSIQIAPPGSFIERSSTGTLISKADWILADSTAVTLTYQSNSSKVTNDDLAFLTLKSPLKSNPLVRIASEDEMLKLKSTSAPIKVYGYGYKNAQGEFPNKPRYLNAEFDNSTNSLANSGIAKSSNSAVCSGDSGGPVVNITPLAITVVGVTTGANITDKCAIKSADNTYKSSFTLLNRYANLAFESLTKLAIKLSAETVKQTALDEAKTINTELQAELEKTNIDNAELTREVNALKNEIENLKRQLPRTITCVKGTLTKKVVAINPKCPSGFKLKIS